MKRNLVVLGLALFAVFAAGQVFGMTIRAAVSPELATDTVAAGTPFVVDIYMNNTDSVDVNAQTGYRITYTTPFYFYSPDSSITTVTHVDSSGSLDNSVLLMNGFDTFWDMFTQMPTWSWDGSLPDSMNFTGVGMNDGWPFDLGEQVYIRFAYQIDNVPSLRFAAVDSQLTTENTNLNFVVAAAYSGTFCIDSCAGRTATYNWGLDDPCPPFNGPYCWNVLDASAGIPTLTTSTLPTGVTFDDNADGTGTFDWTPDLTQAGDYEVTFYASEGASADTEIVVITVMDYTDVGDDKEDILPDEFGLLQNRPNPFNPSTEINFVLPSKCNVSLNIFNILGQKIKNLVNKEYTAGKHSITWNGTTENGIPAASGIYFYKIDAGDYTDTKKMVLLK